MLYTLLASHKDIKPVFENPMFYLESLTLLEFEFDISRHSASPLENFFVYFSY